MRLRVIAWLCLSGAVVSAQATPPAVTLDVVVDDAGPARSPLSATDFVVTDAGEPLLVHSARLVVPPSDGATPLSPIASDDEEKAAATNADRLIGIFVDEYHLSDDAAFARVRTEVATFIRSTLGPRDLVMVVKPLDSLVSLRMTADRDVAARSVETASPRQGDYTPRSAFERDFFAGAPARLDAARNQIALSAVSALAAHLGQFPAGRKTLIVVSNGISGAVPSRRDGPLPALDSIARAANLAHVAVYAFRPSPTPVQASTVDAAAPAHVTPDALLALAERTTGLVVNGDAGVNAGLQRALRDASRYYLLSLAPSKSASSGRFQFVNVAVRAPGSLVRARAGYGVAVDTGALAPRTFSLPEGWKVPRHSSPLIRTWFGQSASDGGATAVAFVWEPAPRVPSGRGAVITPARVTMNVTTMDGTPVFDGTTGPSGRGASLAPGDRPQLAFKSVPGTLLVQMDVLDPAGRVLDHDVRDLTVAAFPNTVAFGTAAVFRSRSLRDVRAILGNTAVVAPVAAREFSRAEHLVVRIPLVHQGGEPEVTVRLQSRFGAAVRELTPTRVAALETAIQVDVPLAPLASGRYSLVFTARNSLGSAVESVDFGVTP
ncbi:MAG: VWA domain-containing protein [Vicinamibacterales bacterium]